jgi:Fe-S-cluster containining protein
MSLQTNITSIALISKQKKEENAEFKAYLKEKNVKEIDTIVHGLSDKITPQIDCTACGNCCANLRPTATREEVGKFAKEEEIDKYMYAESFSCKNLNDKKCTAYAERPQECRSYPYMDRDNFINRTTGILQNYAVCPIVFNIFESLKKELKWSYQVK